MHHHAILCTGVSKTFRQAMYPSVHLQDHLLHWRRHRRMWMMHALRDVHFHAKRGEWVGVYGPNGSGKTTLLRIIAGLLPADAGSVVTQGSMSAFLGLGAGFHTERSAMENVYLHGLLHGLAPKDIRRRMDEIIAFAGIEEHRHVPVKCLSTGMMLRLAYAASAFIDADTYLFDETLAVGDAEFQQRCRAHLRSLKERGCTAVLVSHGLSELQDLCDRIVFLEQGSVVPRSL